MRLRNLLSPLAAAALVSAAFVVPNATSSSAATLASESFDGLSSVLTTRTTDTAIPATTVGYTHTPPNGWSVTNASSMAGLGMDEWRGWAFATPSFWTAAQGGQGRENFTKAAGVLAVADNDEWDDRNNPGDQLFASTLTSPAWSVAGKSAVSINYDSSYRQTGPQVAALEVSFDGGPRQRLFSYSTATLGDQVHLENRAVTVRVTVPAGATSMRASWVIEQARNDWYWAIDDVSLTDQPAAGTEPPLPNGSQVPDGTSLDKVLLVVMDGARYDRMRSISLPSFQSLEAQGSWAPSYIQDTALAGTWSGPGHSSIHTGVWPDKHKVLDNSFSGNALATYQPLFVRLQALRPALSTFSTLDWTPINTYLIGSPDVKLQQPDISDKAATDRASTDAAIAALAQNPDVLHVYLHDADHTGHTLGSDSDAYLDALRRVDGQLGRLVAAVKSRPTYAQERWQIIVTTDHGQTGAGHGGDQHTSRLGWILAAGSGLPVGSTRQWRQVDVLPTILKHLGIPIDPAWGLDGTPIGTASTDPFDTVAVTQGVVDEPAKPSYSGGWSGALPTGWTKTSNTGILGVTEYRGWNLMDAEFWTTSQEGQGRGSFVRSRGAIAVADPDEWNDVGNPVGTGARFDASLRSPWQTVTSGQSVTVDYVSHYKHVASTTDPQKAQLAAEYSNGASTVLWSADAATGALFDISKPMRLTTTAPTGATSVRIRWRLYDAGNNGYWAIDAPKVQVS